LWNSPERAGTPDDTRDRAYTIIISALDSLVRAQVMTDSKEEHHDRSILSDLLLFRHFDTKGARILRLLYYYSLVWLSFWIWVAVMVALDNTQDSTSRIFGALFSLSLGAAPVVVIRSWALRHERRHAPAAPSRDATDTPPPLGHILDSNRRALPPPKPAEQHFQTWISKLMVAAGDDPDRTGRTWGHWLWFLFWALNPAYPLGSFFESGYIEKYSRLRIAKYIQLAIGSGLLALGSFGDGLTHKPRGTFEVLEMTVGTGAFLLPVGFLVFLTNRAVKRRNPNRAAPAGWYPDPLGIRVCATSMAPTGRTRVRGHTSNATGLRQHNRHHRLQAGTQIQPAVAVCATSTATVGRTITLSSQRLRKFEALALHVIVASAAKAFLAAESCGIRTLTRSYGGHRTAVVVQRCVALCRNR